MYLIKTPKFIQNLFPNFTWQIPTNEKELFLTFDDGPIPEVTPWVLETLEKFGAKATFFCVGDNVQKHPSIFENILTKGHAIGNHTFNHLNGWATDNISYFHNIRKSAKICNSELFRPPYGRLKPKQAQFLQRHYKVVMWDTLSGDFDPKIDANTCYRNVIKNAKSGSIIVFHDSLKAKAKLETVLPKTLEYFLEKGYKFSAIKQGLRSENLPENTVEANAA